MNSMYFFLVFILDLYITEEAIHARSNSLLFHPFLYRHIYLSTYHSPTNILFSTLLCDKHSVRKNGYNDKPTYTCLLVLWFFCLLGRNPSMKYFRQ